MKDLEKTTTSTFGTRLKALREEKGLTRTRLAEAIGSSITSVSNWETDAVVPSHKTVEKLAEYFIVFPAWLKTGKGPRTKSEAEQQRRQEIEKGTFTVSKRDEHDLDTINICIKRLRTAGMNNTELEAAHEFLTEIRTALEKRVFFGKRNSSVDSETFTRKDRRQIEDANIILMNLGKMALTSEEKQDVYLIIAGIRTDLEFKSLRLGEHSAEAKSTGNTVRIAV